MNKKGASKGKVLIIGLSSDSIHPLTDKDGFLLCFDTFKQITDYCIEHGINLDDVLIDEMDVLNFEVDTEESVNLIDTLE